MNNIERKSKWLSQIIFKITDGRLKMNDSPQENELDIVYFSVFFYHIVNIYHLHIYDRSHVGASYSSDTQKNAKVALLSLLNNGFYHAKNIEKKNQLRKFLEEMSCDKIGILHASSAKYTMKAEWKPLVLLLKDMVSKGYFNLSLGVLDGNFIIPSDITSIGTP